MPPFHSKPEKVAIVSASVQSLIGQEAMRMLDSLNLTRCSLIDLRDAFVMSADEVAHIADRNSGPI